MSTESVAAPAAPQARHLRLPGGRRAWSVVLMLLGFLIINFADKAVLGLAASPLREELGLTASQYGTASGAFFLLFSVTAVVGGLLADRVPAKWLLLGMALLWSVTQLPVVLFASFGGLLASRLALGMAEGPTLPVVTHALYKWFPADRRSLPTVVVVLGGPLGVVLAAPLVSKVISESGWRAAFVTVALASVVWAGGWLLVGREAPDVPADEVAVPVATAPLTKEGSQAVPDSGSAEREAEGGDTADDKDAAAGAASGAPTVGYLRVLRSRSWLAAAAAAIAVYWAGAQLVAWLPQYLEVAQGYSPERARSLAALPWAVQMAVLLVPGLLAPRLIRKGHLMGTVNASLAAGTAALAAIALLTLPVLPDGLPRLVAVTVGMGLPILIMPLMLTAIGAVIPVNLRGGVLGVLAGVYSTAATLSPVVTGHLIDSASTEKAGYTQAFTVAGVLLLVAAVAVAFLLRPERDARMLREALPMVSEPVPVSVPATAG
ncbi:MFS transporter [Streptomyces sp. NPDC051920]|uniref:MFS transporter n=1 Tax=Streptomyces sp. NPDC051920 TaxID=3155523 RepID=UPI00343815CA